MTSSEADLLSMDHYVRKTFYKTASLMANSCKAVAILGGGDRQTVDVAWEYGRHLGLAFQVCWCFYQGVPFLSDCCAPLGDRVLQMDSHAK